MLTPEQAAKRLGKFGASEAAIIMGGLTTDGLSKLVRRKAGERVFGDLGEESYHSPLMDRGSEIESAALDWFEFEHNVTLLRGEHVCHPTIPNVSATLDGLAPTQFTVEGKCPTFHVWAETAENWKLGKRGFDCIPSEYRWQCRWQPWCADLTDGRFVAFHPVRGGQGIVIPYQITQADCDAMAERVVTVEALVRNWVEILKG